jgi:hypothetical protein
MTDYSRAGPQRREANAKYYRTNKHLWVNVNKEDHMPYLEVPVKPTEDQRVQQYSDWFTKHDGTPPPVFFSAEYVQELAAIQRKKIERVAESSEFRNALYLNNLKHYMAVGEEMPGSEKKWFGK